MATEKSQNDDYRTATAGKIAGVEVTLEFEGNEEVADKLYADLAGRAEELRQIIEEGIHPDATEPAMRVRWEEYWKKQQE